MILMNDYYVYIYYRLDTNEPFYVGMGHNNRWKVLYNRNGYFKNITNKHPTICDIVMDNLTEEQAHGIECWLINELVFEYGYSIDIPNNRSNEKGCHLVNMTWGGEGTSGCNPYENKTEEEMKEMKNKRLETLSNKTEEERNEIKRKISESRKGKYCGEKNPMYGKHHNEESKRKMREGHKGKTESEETRLKKSISHKGLKGVSLPYEKNPNAKSVICLTTKKIFLTAKEGSEYYNISRSEISLCCKGFRIRNGKKYRVKYAGRLSDGTELVWKKLVWNHNKKYRIKK